MEIRKSRFENVVEDSTESTVSNVPNDSTQFAMMSNSVPAPPLPSTGGGDTRVYVGSLHYEIKESDIRMLFSSFGKIKCIDMSFEPGTGRSKGFCFVEYETAAGALAAQAMNNFELAGRNLKVGRPHSSAGQLLSVPPPTITTTSSLPSVSVSSSSSTNSPTSNTPSMPVVTPGMTAKQQAYVLLAQAFLLNGVQPPPAVTNFINSSQQNPPTSTHNNY